MFVYFIFYFIRMKAITNDSEGNRLSEHIFVAFFSGKLAISDFQFSFRLKMLKVKWISAWIRGWLKFLPKTDVWCGLQSQLNKWNFNWFHCVGVVNQTSKILSMHVPELIYFNQFTFFLWNFVLGKCTVNSATDFYFRNV